MMEGGERGRATLALWTGVVAPGWADYNGHMTEHRYLQVFGETTDAFLTRIGVDFEHAADGTYYTLESHIRHLRECHPGTAIGTTTDVLGYDDKRLHLFHSMWRGDDGSLLATGEHLCLHVARSKACPASPAMRERLAALFDAQADMPLPDRTGSVLTKPLTHARV